MIVTTIAIIAAVIVAVFFLAHLCEVFQQRGNTPGYATYIAVTALFLAAVICAILALDDAIAHHQDRAEARIEARMGDLP